MYSTNFFHLIEPVYKPAKKLLVRAQAPFPSHHQSTLPTIIDLLACFAVGPSFYASSSRVALFLLERDLTEQC